VGCMCLMFSFSVLILGLQRGFLSNFPLYCIPGHLCIIIEREHFNVLLIDSIQPSMDSKGPPMIYTIQSIELHFAEIKQYQARSCKSIERITSSVLRIAKECPDYLTLARPQTKTNEFLKAHQIRLCVKNRSFQQ
jgi:hypothetical protein